MRKTTTVQLSDLGRPILPDCRGVMVSPSRVTSIKADMSWLGEPPTTEESKAYERKRNLILQKAFNDRHER